MRKHSVIIKAIRVKSVTQSNSNDSQCASGACALILDVILLALPATLRDRDCQDPRFTDPKTDAQRKGCPGPRPHSMQEAKLGCESRAFLITKCPGC